MTGPCPHCHRPSCPLLADSIIGVRNWIAAYFDCQQAIERWKREHASDGGRR